MLRACSLVVLTIGLSAAVQFCSAQEIPIGPQSPDPHFRALRPNPTAPGLGGMPGAPPDDDPGQKAIAANLRQIEIRRDTEKMLQLTMELKTYLDKADHAAVLSLDAIKKAEQIEKLARGVKSKMKTSN